MLPESPVQTWFQGDGVDPREVHLDMIPIEVRQGFIKAYGTGKTPIFLHGDQGRGKSHAAYYYAAKSYPISGRQRIKWYHSPTDLQHDLITDRQGTCEMWRTAVCVVLDNFGAASKDASKFLTEELTSLLDRRVRQLTMIVSNLNYKKVPETFDAPLASRLLGGTIIEYKGVDRRLTHHKSRT